ncbi:hypothetical protein [Leuconostoc citreum]|uniref:hypothetical protein n=1 Tax=Leuconostoc citreum TaxID=33964 RepID=UPI0025A2C23D|nr:hypothetical protein [Leuconostoc citreum]MDM7641109.1 hypothetical protein [Leuconostoc citreum]
MINNKYITDNESIIKIQKNSQDYLQIDTGFDNCQVMLSEKLFSEKDKLFRFIDTELYDYYNDDATLGVQYLPTHAMKILVDNIDDNIFDQCLREYCPPASQKLIFKKMIDNNQIIPNKLKSEHATSFYISQTPERIDEIIKILKDNLPSLRDYDVAVGNISENYGILEISGYEKTKDPVTFHCSFWKFNTVSLNEIGKNFVKSGENYVI